MIDLPASLHTLPMISWRVLALGLACAAVCGCRNAHPPGTVPPPDTAQARQLNDRAVPLIGRGNYDAAERLLERALAADPAFGPVRNNLGLIAYHRGDLYQAAWQFESASRLMPHQAEPLNNLGLVLERAGRLDDAIDAYTRARQIDPDNVECMANLARARVRRGDRDDSLKKLLQDLVLRDTRPTWNEWERFNLARLASPQTQITPASRPDESAP